MLFDSDPLAPVFDHCEVKDSAGLLRKIRHDGVFKMGSADLRAISNLALKQYSNASNSPQISLLRRLASASLPPSYPLYISEEILCAGLHAGLPASQLGRLAFRRIYDLLDHLIKLPELYGHPRLDSLEHRVNQILSNCRELSFTNSFLPTPHDDIAFTLLPESDIMDELVFLRVVQGTEIVFKVSSFLADHALQEVAYGEILEAMATLHWLVMVEALLLPMLGLLASMTVDKWEAIRPLIVKPSAIQSMSFHILDSRLKAIGRIMQHPRVPEHQQSYLPTCLSLLEQASQSLNKWYIAHSKIAAKYGRATKSERSEGIKWLDTQEFTRTHSLS